MRSIALALVVLAGVAHGDPVAPARPGELVKLRIENTIKRAQFDGYMRRGGKLVARTMDGLREAGVQVNKAPKFGMKDAQADRMIGSARRELELLEGKPSTSRRAARIATLKSQLAEYDAMPRTGPRTSAFVLLGQDQVYLRLDRKGATPSMLANTISHEMVHIRDLPKTNALWDAGLKDEAKMADYKAFLTDGETRAYGEGSRVGARLGETPFGLGQPITDPNATDHALVQRSITRKYMLGVKQKLKADGTLEGATKAQRALADLYLAGYRSAMPEVLAEREAWKKANPPKDGLVANLEGKWNDLSSAASRMTAPAMQLVTPIRTADQAFAAGQADVRRDLHPSSRLGKMLK